MLRGLVLLLLLVNAAIFAWTRMDPRLALGDREPQRLDRQVAPDSVKVLPDLPAPASGAAESTTIDFADTPASAPSAALPAASGASAAGARQVAASGDCVESGALDDHQLASLRQTLTRAGVPPDALVERREIRPASWMIYMGRYADEPSWQRKADELRRMNLRFERVSRPPGLDPGLSLGNFSSQAAAQGRLDELGKRGVRTARIVEAAASAVARHPQVRATDASWRSSVGTQRFAACPVPAAVALVATAASAP